MAWWYFDEGRRFGLEAELPAAEGAVVARALGRLAERVPVMPGEEDAMHTSELASGGSGELEEGGVVPAQTVGRLLCNGRVQTVLEDRTGEPVRPGRMSREPSAAMMRHLRYRDRECRFPGCGTRRFTQAHHIVWWERGGRTDPDNLVLVCTFHHKLVHEHG